MDEKTLPSGILSMEPASADTPSSSSQVTSAPRRRRVGLLVLIVAGIFLLISGALGFVAYKGIFAVNPAALVPKNTLAYISVATYEKGDDKNPWNELQGLLRYFPLIQNLEIEDATQAFEKGVNQLLGESVSLEKLPAIGDEIIIAVTHMPTIPSATDLPGVLVFVPLKNPMDLLDVLNEISDSSKVRIESISEEKILYKLTITDKRFEPAPVLFATAAGRNIVLGVRQQDVSTIADRAGLRNVFSFGETFSDVSAYKKIRQKIEGKRPLVWYVAQQELQDPLKIFSLLSDDLTPSPTQESSKRYTAGQFTITPEGISVSTWRSDFPDVTTFNLSNDPQALIHVLPEKIMDTWVSFYAEQRDLEKRITELLAQSSEKNRESFKNEFKQETGLEFEQDVLPLLDGHVAFIVAPRYDGYEPHMALVLQTLQSEVELKDRSNKIFSVLQNTIEKEFQEAAATSQETISQYQEFGIEVPAYLQTLASAKLERTEEVFQNSTIVTLRVPNKPTFKGLAGISYVVIGQRLIISSNPNVVKEIATSLAGQNSIGAVSKNNNLVEHIQKHPVDAAGFIYLYPQGVVGILKWIFCGAEGGLCQIGEERTEALAEVMSSYLLITRTSSSSVAPEDGGAVDTGFVKFVPLSADEQLKFNQSAKVLGLTEEDLNQSSEEIGKRIEDFFSGIVAIPNARKKAQNARIKSNIGQLRVIAEVYYDNNAGSYAGVDQCFSAPSAATCLNDQSTVSSVEALRNDTSQAVNGSSFFEVNSTANQFCISHNLLDAGKHVCVDATGQFKEAATATCGAVALQCPN